MSRAMRIALSVLLVAAAIAPAAGCSGSPAKGDVTVAVAPFESNGLVFVAQERGMFSDRGLAITFVDRDTGVAALDAVVAGEADIAVGTAEFPLVAKAFQGVPVKAIATIDRPEFIYLIGRKDRGIMTADDLAGKRIGTTAGSIAQFYLGRFLELNNIPANKITFVDLRKPQQWRQAISNGTVDAVVLAQPEASIVRDGLAKNATFLSVQASQPAYTLAISTNEWLAANPQLAEAFLSALADAEAYAASHPDEATAIIQKRLGLDPSYIGFLETQNTFALSLDQSMILAMEDEARWMMRSGLVTATVMPALGAYVDADPLAAVNHDAVNILP